MKSIHRLWRTVWLCTGILMCGGTASAFIVDHQHTDITQIPESAIDTAKANLHIAYGHTSHGSQLTTGMTGLISFANGGGLGLSLPDNIFAWNNGGTGGALDLHDYAMGGDVGYYPQWVNNTRAYLGTPDLATGRGTSNTDVNVIIWSWCGQVSGSTEATMISNYLTPMNQLELDYPGITFVYMTGHVNISADANTKARNNQIRDYCQINNKVLYDFADIEHYNPDGTYFEYVNDNCNYYNSATELQGNWATEWQTSHTEGVDWYTCSSAHSQSLNANRKAYAAWWLWAYLGGWDGGVATHSLAITKTGSGLVTSSPPGISCGADCSEDYSVGSAVFLSPLADEGWNFTSWSGDCSGTGTCEVTMDSDKVVTAEFSLQGDVDGNGNGNGNLSLSDVITGLQVCTGSPVAGNIKGDVDGNSQIGIPEVIYVLNQVTN